MRLFRHQYAVEMRLSVSQRSSEWVVRLPDVVPLWTVKSLGWPARSLVRPSKKRPFIPSLRLLASDLLAGVKSGSPPRRLFAISTNLVNLRAEGKEPHIRSETVRHRKTITNPKWTDFVLFEERPQAWLCLRGSSCRACRHRAAVSLMASPTAPAPTSSPPCDTLLAPSGCRPPEPCVRRSTRSAPAFFAHGCTSLLCSFSTVCLWRYLRSPPALRCTGLSAICFAVFASLLRTLLSCLFRPLRNNTCRTRKSC